MLRSEVRSLRTYMRPGPSDRDDDIRQGRPQRGCRPRIKPPIQQILRRGDEVLVQVIKEGIGTKGPTLSTYISIPGHYLVLMPALGRWKRPQWNSYAMKEAWRRIKPFLLGQTYAKSDPLIDRFLTSLTTAGWLNASEP